MAEYKISRKNKEDLFGNDPYKLSPGNDQALVIINALRSEAGSFISGSSLAKLLGLSRPAIHGKINKLRDEGFVIDAVRNKGYCLIKEPEVIHGDLLRDYAKKIGVAMEVLYFPVIDSTNSEAERQLSRGREGPFAIVSSCQTRGRGRLGRNWHSASTENLYLSVAFEPKILPQALQNFTLWAGIRICRALQNFTPGAPLKIKWPNDLHCGDRKFAGMLTEAKIDADSLSSIIFGIGLNINSNPAKYPASICKSATSLSAVSGAELSLSAVAAATIAAIQSAYETSIHGAGSESLISAWKPLSSLEGSLVTAIVNGQEILGTASGIDSSGALLLTTEDGAIQKIYAGDVTLKK